jgi:hypothetical protein
LVATSGEKLPPAHAPVISHPFESFKESGLHHLRQTTSLMTPAAMSKGTSLKDLNFTAGE